MINIGDKYYIDADRYGLTLYKSVYNKAKKEEQLKNMGYPTNIENALLLIYKIETHEWINQHDATLKQAAKAFRKIWEEIKEYGGNIDAKCER